MSDLTEPKSSKSITDVAKASGVSVATVSRVLNGLGGVSEETAKHVRLVMSQLAYRPLRLRKRPSPEIPSTGTGNLAVITLGQASAWLELPVMASAINGVRAASDSLGYRMLLSEVLDPATPGALFRNREIDGAIVFVSSSFKTNEVAAALRSLHEQLPVVWAMGGPLAVDVDHVYPDHYCIGRIAYTHLNASGCRNVAYVSTSPAWELMRTRGHAFLDAAADSGEPGHAFILTQDQALADSYGRHVITASTNSALVEKIAAMAPKIDGLFIANDRTTAELYPLLVRAGLIPGRDLVIVSCDNEGARLASLDPRPTTIDINAEQIGRRAVLQLIKRLAQPDEPPLTMQLPPKLITP